MLCPAYQSAEIKLPKTDIETTLSGNEVTRSDLSLGSQHPVGKPPAYQPKQAEGDRARAGTEFMILACSGFYLPETQAGWC